jgi:hypothetical protein
MAGLLARACLRSLTLIPAMPAAKPSYITSPPSTTKAWPVAKAASSDAR